MQLPAKRVRAAAFAAAFYRSLAVLLANRLRFNTDDRVTAGMIWG